MKFSRAGIYDEIYYRSRRSRRLSRRRGAAGGYQRRRIRSPRLPGMMTVRAEHGYLLRCEQAGQEDSKPKSSERSGAPRFASAACFWFLLLSFWQHYSGFTKLPRHIRK